MSAKTYKLLQAFGKWQITATTQSKYNNSRIMPLGIATLTVKHKSKEYSLEFFIEAHDAYHYSRVTICSNLDILRRVDAVMESSTAMTQSNLLD